MLESSLDHLCYEIFLVMIIMFRGKHSINSGTRIYLGMFLPCTYKLKSTLLLPSTMAFCYKTSKCCVNEELGYSKHKAYCLLQFRFRHFHCTFWRTSLFFLKISRDNQGCDWFLNWKNLACSTYAGSRWPGSLYASCFHLDGVYLEPGYLDWLAAH